jgi:predicted permease
MAAEVRRHWQAFPNPIMVASLSGLLLAALPSKLPGVVTTTLAVPAPLVIKWRLG